MTTTPRDLERAPVPKNGASADKATKFGWIVRDRRGTHMRINKHLLRVDNADDGYQRDLTHARAVEIAKAWSWAACGCLIVARRPNGSLWVIDGQHRHHGALLHSGVTDLDCLVWDIDDRTWEAEVFLLIQRHRAPVTSHQVFRTQRLRGDATAIAAESLAASIGRTVRNSGDAHSLACIGEWMFCINKNRRAITAIAPLLGRLCQGQRLDKHLVSGLFDIECRLEEFSQSLADPYWTERCLTVGAAELLSSGRKMRELLGSHGPKANARGFYTALTKRTRREVPDLFGDRNGGTP